MHSLCNDVYATIFSNLPNAAVQLLRGTCWEMHSTIDFEKCSILEYGVLVDRLDMCEEGLRLGESYLKAIPVAAAHGNLHVLDWVARIAANTTPNPAYEEALGKAYHIAAKHGQREVIDWLRAPYPDYYVWVEEALRDIPHQEIIDRAHAECRGLDDPRWYAVDWARNHDCELGPDGKFTEDSDACYVLSYVYAAAYPWGQDTMDGAIIFGDPELVDHLKNLGCPWEEGISCVAAQHDRLEILEYMYEEGRAKIDEYTMSTAAGNNNVRILEYLYSMGCYIDEYAVLNAANGGCTEALEYLLDRGAPEVYRTIGSAVSSGSIETVAMLIRRGYATGGCDKSAAYRGKFVLLEWLIENGHAGDVHEIHRSMTDKYAEPTTTPEDAEAKLRVIEWMKTQGVTDL